MKVTKPVIIVLAVALVAVIGYAFYLHRGPLKNIFNENQDLKNKIAHLKTTSGEIKAAYNSDLTAKIQLVEKLQKTNMELETSVERIRIEKETAGTDFQKQIASFETLLAQNDRELQIFHGENQQLRTAERELQEKVQSLENQLVQKEIEAQTSHEENQQLRTAETALHDKVQSLENQLAQKQTEAQISHEENQQLRTTETELRGMVKSPENQLTQKVGEAQTFREEIQQLRKAEADLQGRIESLGNHLTQKEREAQTLRVENRELQKTIVALDSNRAVLIQKSAYLNKQLQESKSQIEVLNQEMAGRDEKLDKMAEERQALLGQIGILEEEKENLSRETQELNSQLGMSRAQLDAVSQEAVSKEKKLWVLNQSYEDLKTRLHRQIQEKEFKISTLENKLNICLLNKILFAPGQTAISPNGKRVLNNLAEELKKVEGILISVEDHTDNQPLGGTIRNIYIDNLGLSFARSAAVARTLRKMGVNPQILSAAGYSMHRPIAANAAPDGQQQNRRVEIILAPLH